MGAPTLRSNYFSHDNVFHTLLGMSRVSSSYYNPELDISGPLPTLGFASLWQPGSTISAFVRPGRIVILPQKALSKDTVRFGSAAHKPADGRCAATGGRRQ